MRMGRLCDVNDAHFYVRRATIIHSGLRREAMLSSDVARRKILRLMRTC